MSTVEVRLEADSGFETGFGRVELAEKLLGSRHIEMVLGHFRPRSDGSAERLDGASMITGVA
ncbi:MAG: hypothetical protein MJA83_04060, partial [Gammaproteobacteria bacterium]|nr:hypothetical protein [Gammaproteobacteria bacterium]